jgi:hypothetical protein
MERKISEYDFVVRAIKKLRKPPYKGIHTVYSGFNQAFKEYFDKNPVEVTKKLAEEGKIAVRPVRGGVMLYLPEEAPAPRGSANALRKILGDDDEPEKEPTTPKHEVPEEESDDELIILGPATEEKE